MMTIPGQLNPSPRLLLGPGPSDAHPRVLSAMTTPLLGHLDPQFLEMMNETQEMMREVFRTQNKLTFPVSATGSAGMECCLHGEREFVLGAEDFAHHLLGFVHHLKELRIEVPE